MPAAAKSKAAKPLRHSGGDWTIGVLKGDGESIYVVHSADDEANAGVILGEFAGPDARANVTLFKAAPGLLRELLAVEWAGTGDDEDGGTTACCPSCGGDRGAGHNDGCTLAAALASARGS